MAFKGWHVLRTVVVIGITPTPHTVPHLEGGATPLPPLHVRVGGVNPEGIT